MRVEVVKSRGKSWWNLRLWREDTEPRVVAGAHLGQQTRLKAAGTGSAEDELGCPRVQSSRKHL